MELLDYKSVSRWPQQGGGGEALPWFLGSHDAFDSCINLERRTLKTTELNFSPPGLGWELRA